MTDLWRLSASELAGHIRRREVSAREAAQAALDRLDAVNPRINAVVEHRPAEVLAQADAIDQAIRRGDDAGPLGGVPVTTKLDTDQAGFATSNGAVTKRNTIATSNSPVVDNLLKGGAVLLGRTNMPAFAYRWFTDNKLFGATRNPRDPAITPGGSSGGGAAAVASGIGHLAQGTDIGGSVRYPAYACGVHALRPSLGRIPYWNATSAQRPIGSQLMGVAGPIARTIADLRLALAVMAARDVRDIYWAPVPLEEAPVKQAAMCLRPNGMTIVPAVETALLDAKRRLEAAGWMVEEIADTPSFDEASRLQVRLWLGDGFAEQWKDAKREGDPGALAMLGGFRKMARRLPADFVAQVLVRRGTLTQEWLLFMEQHPVLLVPVAGELPFPDALDLTGDAGLRRVCSAVLTQTGLPLMGLPGLTVSTGMVGTVPVGVQVIARRYREDLCLLAGEAIEAGGVPASPIDPA